MRHSVYIAASAIVCIAFVGCAMIIHGTTQDVRISSSPPNAQVAIDGKPWGRTPIVATLSRKHDHAVTIALEGYKPFVAALSRKASGWAWGNIALGGPIGLAVDAISGGLFNLTPAQISGQLVSDGNALVSDERILIMIVTRADSNWQRIGTLTRS
jgi:hypothetical protein